MCAGLRRLVMSVDAIGGGALSLFGGAVTGS